MMTRERVTVAEVKVLDVALTLSLGHDVRDVKRLNILRDLCDEDRALVLITERDRLVVPDTLSILEEE